MNKILKIVAVFVLGIGVLTGCTDKVAQKITNDTEKTQDVTTNKMMLMLMNKINKKIKTTMSSIKMKIKQ